MIKFASIVPTKYLPLTDGREIHMALAHLIGKDKVYTEFFKGLGDDTFVIMDNGVIEGAPQPIQKIIECAKIIGADEIVLPDVFMDKQRTLEQTYEAIEIARKELPGVKLMAVPQGNTIEEWMECVDIMLTFDIDTIGIPKVLTKLGGRDARLDVLNMLGRKLRGLDIHLLGCWESPFEMSVIRGAIEKGYILPVRSMDSAIPYVYAQCGFRVSEGSRPNIEVNFDSTNVDEVILDSNIQEVDRHCGRKFESTGNVIELK